MKTRRLTFLTGAVLAATAVTATAAVRIDTTALRDLVTVAGIRTHLSALQAIADQNGDTRASGTPGYKPSGDYVVGQLDQSYFTVTTQPFTFAFFQERSPAELARVSPDPQVYVLGEDFLTMEYSGSGAATATVQAVDLVLPPGPVASTSNSGCEASDFAGFTAGNIALVQRGTCDFVVKALNAEAAGAIGAIIFNEGQEGRTEVLNGTLGRPAVGIPTVGTTFALGNELAQLLAGGPVVVSIKTDTVSENRDTFNVIAETKTGRADRVAMAGAHLDSVPEGPGINDNGSGSAVLLETAIQMAKSGVQPVNRVRFAWWGAEESGLLGSAFYVSQLSSRGIKDIAVYLNFDMVGSPNYARFVYDGDGSAFGIKGPTGSKTIEEVFTEYFTGQGLASAPTAFDGRSDYDAFIDVGIPAGGLFTGAEDVKTAAEAELFGGEAGVAFDRCYHQACDTIANVNDDALDEMSDATVHALQSFAMTTSAVNGTDKGKGAGQFKGVFEYRGSHLIR